MYQSDRGNYKTNEPIAKAFMNICLGKLMIFVAFILVMLLIAYLTTPTEKEMKAEMEDNIMQSLDRKSVV